MDNYIKTLTNIKLFNPENIIDIYNHNPLISLKSNGYFKEIFIDNINIYPNINSKYDIYSLIGEYLEDYNLLLVFAIKLYNHSNYKSNIITLYDTNLFLDKLYSENTHILFDYNDTIIQQIDNRIKLINSKKELRSNILNWIPKGYWSINNYISSNYYTLDSFNNFIKHLDLIYNYIILIKDYTGIFLTSNKISQYNREYSQDIIKIIPLNKISININVIYNFNTNSKYRYITNDNKDITKLIINNNNDIEYNKIYKCYPIFKNNQVLFQLNKLNNHKNNADYLSNINNKIYLINNYFNIINLLDYYIKPWYKNINKDTNNHLITYSYDSKYDIFKSIDGLYKNVLDISCGNFKSLKYLLSNINHNIDYYLGLDIDLSSINKAKYNIRSKNIKIKKYDFMFYDITKSLIENYNNSFKLKYYVEKYNNLINRSLIFDYILSFFSLNYIEDMDIFLDFINKKSKIGTFWIIQNLDSDKIKESNIFKFKDNKLIIEIKEIDFYHTEYIFSFSKFIKKLENNWRLISMISHDNINNNYINSLNTICLERFK